MTARRFLLLLACLAAGCQPGPKPVPPIAQSGELVVLTVNGPATYFEDAQGLPSGFEYDLVNLSLPLGGVTDRESPGRV